MIPLGVLASTYVTSAGGGGYYDEVMADSPALYWRLGESSGTTAADASGNARPGIYAGSLTRGTTGLITGDSDTALTIPNGGGYAYREYESWMSSLPAWTMEMVADIGSANGGGLVMGFSTAGVKNGFHLYTRRLYYKFNDAELGFYAMSSGVKHFAIQFGGGSRRFFVNGVQQYTGSQTYAAPPVDSWFAAGRYVYSGGTAFTANGACVIDEVAVYPTVLPAARILAHAQAAGVVS